eukprot:9291936-Pyramimonas_sp.AAC.1
MEEAPSPVRILQDALTHKGHVLLQTLPSCAAAPSSAASSNVRHIASMGGEWATQPALTAQRTSVQETTEHGKLLPCRAQWLNSRSK